MKTIKFLLLLVFLTSPIFIFSNFRPSANGSFGATVETEPERIRVLIDKPANSLLTVQVTDQDGWPLYASTLDKQQTSSPFTFNLNGLPDGQYQLRLSNGKRTKISQIQLVSTGNPANQRQVLIQPIN
ncbi:hypothetical protein [Spirosoma sp. 209]|uniref:hypothetical protein n=1 Tax=Spirosoma sp. 209 TaxID=1955701 RepID=UPI00098CF90A|nr:hypothetical protein [Spirosoma sp. 209]